MITLCCAVAAAWFEVGRKSIILVTYLCRVGKKTLRAVLQVIDETATLKLGIVEMKQQINGSEAIDYVIVRRDSLHR